MTEISTELVVPGIGQLVNLDEPREVALAIDAIRDLEYQLRAAKQDLTRALVYASQQAGSKTLRLDGVEAVVKGGKATHYDADEIRADLFEAGMSEQRVGEIVVETVSYKVSAVEAKRAGGANETYREVIEKHTTTIDVPHTVSVSIKQKEQS